MSERYIFVWNFPANVSWPDPEFMKSINTKRDFSFKILTLKVPPILSSYRDKKNRQSQGRSQGGADGAAAPPWHVTAPPWWGSGAEVGQPVFWSTQKII